MVDEITFLLQGADLSPISADTESVTHIPQYPGLCQRRGSHNGHVSTNIIGGPGGLNWNGGVET